MTVRGIWLTCFGVTVTHFTLCIQVQNNLALFEIGKYSKCKGLLKNIVVF